MSAALIAFFQSVVSTLTALLPTITSWGAIPDEIISLLIQALPIAISEAEELVTPIENIIAAIKSSGAVTPAQMAALQALQASTDAAAEAAATAAGDPAPPASNGSSS